MKWLPIPDRAHQGKTLPEVFLLAPAFVINAVKAREFRGPLLAQAKEVCRRAKVVRVPLGDDVEQDVVVFYFLLPDGNYSGHAAVGRSDPKLSQYEKFSVAKTDNCLDLTMPMRIAPGDPAAPTAMVEALKFTLLGDPHAVLSRQQCEAFFDDDENFVE